MNTSDTSDIRTSLLSSVEEVIKELGLSAKPFTMEPPPDKAMGHYATNIALLLAKEAKMVPPVLAKKIADMVQEKKAKYVDRVAVAGGFINFFLTPEYFAGVVTKILKEGEDFAKGKIGMRDKGTVKKTILVEFSSPNVAKPFTVGHLRSTIIGDAVAKLLAWQGHTVVRDNHLGDWGTQFGNLLAAITRWGNMETIRKATEPMRELVGLYVRFHEESEKDEVLKKEGAAWFAKLEAGDKEARAVYTEIVTLSKAYFAKIYQVLGVNFDTTLGESFFEDRLEGINKILKEKNLITKSEGAELVFFPLPDEKGDKFPPLMVRKTDGTSLYATRDLATDQYRLKTYGKDVTIINETGNEQNLYFKQIFETEYMLGWFKRDQRVHISHGLYRFKEGKMSTRKGNVIWLEDIITEAIDRAKAVNEKVAKEVGLGAIKFNDLKREAKQDIVFDWDEMLNLKGDSGPYVQYAYARTCSVLAQAKKENLVASSILPTVASSTWQTRHLEVVLSLFPEVIERAAKQYAPQILAAYLLEVASAFSRFYAEEKIVVPEDTASPYRLALTEACGIILKNGLTILGIESPTEI